MAKPTPGSGGIDLHSKYIASCAACKTLIFFTHKQEFNNFNADPYCSEECTFLSLQNWVSADSTPKTKQKK